MSSSLAGDHPLDNRQLCPHRAGVSRHRRDDPEPLSHRAAGERQLQTGRIADLTHRVGQPVSVQISPVAADRARRPLASFFDSHPRVEAVHYPTLPGHPHHARSKELEGCGGVLSIAITGSVGEVDAMLGRLRLCKQAPSLGGVETLVTRPATTSHAGLSPEERRAAGIGDTLVRIAVGIEDPEDLVEDFRQALDG